MKVCQLMLLIALASSVSLCAAEESAGIKPVNNASVPQELDSTASLPAPVPNSGSLFRMFGGLLFCLGVFGAGIHLSRRYGFGQLKGGKRRMRVIEKLPISQKSSLLLVSCDGREILLSVGPDQARVLQAQLTPSRESFEESFADMYSATSEEKQCVG